MATFSIIVAGLSIQTFRCWFVLVHRNAGRRGDAAALPVDLRPSAYQLRSVGDEGADEVFVLAISFHYDTGLVPVEVRVLVGALRQSGNAELDRRLGGALLRLVLDEVDFLRERVEVVRLAVPHEQLCLVRRGIRAQVLGDFVLAQCCLPAREFRTHNFVPPTIQD